MKVVQCRPWFSKVATTGSSYRDLATDGLQIPAVTMTNAPLKPVEW